MWYQPSWSEATAVGSKEFVEALKRKMGVGALGRKIESADCAYILRELESAYTTHFEAKKLGLSLENTVFFNKSNGQSIC